MKTVRGFVKIAFKDLGGYCGSVQESSADIPGGAVWVGLEKGVHGEDFDGSHFCSASAHIDRQTARKIARLLLHFADTGHLPDETDGTR